MGGGGSDTACRGSGSTGGVKGSGTGAGASAVDGSVATVFSGELPSPVVAAGASLASFAVGAIIPLIPYLFGLDVLAVALGLAAVAAIAGGGMVARLTDRPFWRGAVRQLILGACAVAITYLIGVGVGHVAA